MSIEIELIRKYNKQTGEVTYYVENRDTKRFNRVSKTKFVSIRFASQRECNNYYRSVGKYDQRHFTCVYESEVKLKEILG